MSRASFIKRLEVLEARRNTRFVPARPPPLATYIIALFGGCFDPVQSTAVNFCRAIGCKGVADLADLSPDELAERQRTVWAKICRRRKIDPVTLEPRGRFDRLLKQLEKSGIVPDAVWGNLTQAKAA